MHIAFKRGEQPVKVKKPTRKEQVAEMAAILRAKWEARDRAAAKQKYLTSKNSTK